MADEKVGIKIVAKDLTSKVLKGIAKSGRGAASGINAIPSAIKKATVAFSVLSTGVNQAFELWAKVRERIISTISVATAASMEFRSATDPMKTWWEDQAKGVQELQARIGDVLLPVMKGLSDAVGDVGGSVADWLRINRAMIASKILEWIAGLIDGVGKLIQGLGALSSVAAIVKAAFWKMIAGLNTIVGALIQSIGQMLGNFAAVAKVVGADGIGASLAEGAKSVKEWSEVFGSSATEALENSQAAGRGVTELADRYANAGQSVRKFAQRVREAGAAAIAGDTGAGGTAGSGERQAAMEKAKATAKIIASLDLRIHTARQAMHDQRKKWIEEDKEAVIAAEQAKQRFILKTGADIMLNMGVAWSTAIGENKKAEDVFKDVMKSMVSTTISAMKQVIMANAAAAATAAAPGAAASSGIAAPLVVPVVMATVLGLVQGMVNKMALGGEVRGGTPGRDTVPALLMSGERVLTRSENARLKRQERTGGGQVHVTIAPQMHSQFPPTEQQRTEIVSGLAMAIEEAVSDGRLRLGAL